MNDANRSGTSWWRLTGAVVLTAALAVFVIGNTGAQDAENPNGEAPGLRAADPAEPGDGEDSGPVRRFVYLDESFELNDLVHKAGFFEMQDNWTKAFAIYQQVLRDAQATTLVRLDDRTFGNLRAHVCRHLATMPEERRHQYRLLYDDAARALLDEAMSPLDAEALEQVATVYFATSVGDDALAILGDVCRERGEWERAVGYWRQVLEVYPDTDQDRAQLWAKVAVGYARLGDRPRAEAALKELAGLTDAAASVSLAGERISLSSRLGPTLARLEDTPTPAAGAEGWPQVGGSARHVGVSPAAPPADVRTWRFDLPGPPPTSTTPRIASAYMQQYVKEIFPHSAIVPVAAGSRVFIHNGRGVYALDPTSGKTVWAHTESLPSAMRRDPQTGRVYPVNRTGVGGQAVCAVCGNGVFAVLGGRNQLGARLVAVSRDTGKRLWSLDLPPRGSGINGSVSHASEAVAADGAVFVRIAVSASGTTSIYRYGGHQDHHVLAVDAATGKLRWHRFVCTAASAYSRYYGYQQPQAPQLIVPAVDGRRVYISTNGGAVAALDVRTGEVLWASLYEKSEVDPRTRVRMLVRRTAKPADIPPPWRSSAPLVVGDKVLFTPTDADALYCFEAETGFILWQRPRGKAEFVVGARAGRVFIVGDRV